MMKRFVSAMLGSLAAIWISFLLLVVLMSLFIAAVMSDSFSRKIIADNFKENTVLRITLSGDIPDRATPKNIFETMAGLGDDVTSLQDIVNALDAAASDPCIEGVFLDCKGSEAGLATRCEIIEAINRFQDSGKWVVAYADNYTQSDYFVAMAANKIYLNPVGMLDIHGLAATTTFYKGLLDKLGVEMQVVKVGTYKSAVEPFIMTGPSEASRHQQRQFLDDMWMFIKACMSEARGLDENNINQLADSMLLTYTPERYVELGLVDELVYWQDFEDIIKINVGLDATDDLLTITPQDYCRIANIPHSVKNCNRIAVVYAEGEISDDGTSGIVASTLVPELYKITDDDEIDALVLRVNSGGGSAFASEQIWDALERFKSTGRPLYVSMGNYAASGGYYISCGADKIYADALTLTGSIGIFGIIPCVKGLLNDHLGITMSSVTTNANGDFPSATSPMTPFQRAQMQKEIERGYELFVKRCAEGRGMSVDSIKTIAQGRVWDALTAYQIGLVDELGTLHDAISDIASELGFGSNYCIREYPAASGSGFFSSVSGMKSRIEKSALKRELGDNLDLYEKMKRIGELAPVQCRMEDITVY